MTFDSEGVATIKHKLDTSAISKFKRIKIETIFRNEKYNEYIVVAQSGIKVITFALPWPKKFQMPDKTTQKDTTATLLVLSSVTLTRR